MEDRRECTSYRVVILPSLSGNMCAMLLEKRCREVKVNDTYSTVFITAVTIRTKFSLSRKIQKSWAHAKDLHTFLWT